MKALSLILLSILSFIAGPRLSWALDIYKDGTIYDRLWNEYELGAFVDLLPYSDNCAAFDDIDPSLSKRDVHFLEEACVHAKQEDMKKLSLHFFPNHKQAVQNYMEFITGTGLANLGCARSNRGNYLATCLDFLGKMLVDALAQSIEDGAEDWATSGKAVIEPAHEWVKAIDLSLHDSWMARVIPCSSRTPFDDDEIPHCIRKSDQILPPVPVKTPANTHSHHSSGGIDCWSSYAACEGIAGF